MRTIAKDKSSSAVSESGTSSADGAKENWFRMHWCMVALSVIAILAFVLRFVFAYGPSVGDSFALSGGATASSHHRIIVEILYGTYSPSNEVSLNYPYGIESIYGPLFDYCCAAWAKLFSAFGASYPDAANMALAVNPPIFGALTCIPVFLIAKRFTKDDVIAVVAAGFYAVFPILVMTTPFSYGSELPFVCFLMAGLVYFVLSAFDNVDKYAVTGIKGVFTQKPVLLWVALAALFMTLIVYSWTGFWAIVMASSVMLFFALIFDRIGGRDIGATVGIFLAVVTVPILLGAIYYVKIGAWESVLSGAFVLTVITSVCAVIFLALEKKPWVLSIPLVVVIIGVVAAVLHFAAPEIASAVYSGNSAYVGTLMNDLITEGNRTSISAMAAYYGWVTVWFPLILGVWMAIKYRANGKSKAYTFVMLWLLAGFIACWFNTEYAVITGAVFAVASAITVVGVIRFVNLKTYFRSLKGNGFKAGVKKALKPIPLATVIVAVFLIAVPTAVYAVDAATPTNDENISYFGGLGYTINTSDSSLVNSAWSGYHPTQEATLLTWYGYSDAASSVGGYKTVTSPTGAGTSAMSSVYLSEGSKEVIATMIVRLVEDNAAKYTSYFQNVSGTIDVSDVVNYIDNEDAARSYIKAHSSDFAGYNSTISKENLPYLAAVHYLSSKLTEKDMNSLYTDIRGATSEQINYIELDGSMLPIYYGDSSYANYIAYFGDLALGGTYPAPSKLYSVSTTTAYYYQYGYYDQLYYTYTDSMYATFLWNALIGVTPSEYGYSDSLSLLSALAKSDGTVKTSPCAGIDNFDIAYWHVNYQAEGSSDWKDMSINDALALQNTNGGYINYLSSVIILEYNCSTSYDTTSISGATDYSGIRVAVYEELVDGDMGYDPSGKTSNYVQRSTAMVDSSTGVFTLSVPSTGNYLVKYYVGATNLYNGTLIYTASMVEPYALPVIATQTGTLVDGDGNAVKSYAYLQFIGSDNVPRTVEVDANNGTFSIDNVRPDKYTVNVYGASDVLLNTVTLTLSDANGTAIDGLTISAGACEIDITVKDLFGNTLSGEVFVSITDALGNSANVPVTDGSKKLSVLAGTYSVSIDNGDYVSVSSTSVTASTKEAVSASLTAYPAKTISTSAGTIVMGLGYSKVSTSSNVNVPETLADSLTRYLLSNDKTEVTVNGAAPVAALEVKGTLKNGGSNVPGTVSYINTVTGAVFTFATDSNGEFTVYVPAGDYMVYATNGSSLAVFASENITAGTTVSYDLKTAVALTVAVNYETLMSPTTNGLSYIPADVTVDGKTFTVITGSSGEYKLYVPTETQLKLAVSKDVFSGTTKIAETFTVDEDFSSDLTVTSAKAETFTIKAKAGSGVTASVNTISVSFETEQSASITFNFDAYTSSSYDFEKDIADGATFSDLVPGRYTVTSKTDGYYVSKTVYIYPSTTTVDLSDVMECEKITVTKADSNDVVKVVKLTSNTDKTVVTDGDDYYLPAGDDYYVTITNEKGDKTGRFDATGTISGYTLAAAHTLSGYVGSKVTGTIVATDSNSDKYLIDVKDGEYSILLAEGVVINSMEIDASATPDSSQYTYSVSGNLNLTSNITIGDKDVVRNFIQSTSRADATGDVIEKVEFLSGSKMENGVGTLNLKVTRVENTPADVSYVITSGSAFELSQSYLVRFTGGATEATVTVVGHYNDKAVGAGNKNASLIFSTIDGTEEFTAVIPSDLYGNYFGVETAETESTMDGFSYRYGFAFKNDFEYAVKIKVTGISYSGSEYVYAVSDASQYFVSAINGEMYELPGFATTSLYIVLVKADDSVTANVPETLTVNYDYYDASGAFLLDGSSTVDRASAELTVDKASVSGGNADNNEVGVSKGFWIVTVFTILLLLLLVYSGMKRGVFTRRK